MMLRSLMHSPRARFGEDPFTTVQRALERAMGDSWNLTSSLPTEAAALSVRVDVKEDAQAYHVTAELPGLGEKDVDITFDDGLLTIRGEKKVERDEKKDTWHVVERSQGSFARQLSLPANVDAEKIEASFDQGVLNVTLPKMPPEQTKAKKITIKTS